MNILKLAAFLLGLALFTGLGTTTLSAEGMKCGAGKCGSAMEKPKVCNSDENCKCECHGKKGAGKDMKCGSAKCGASGKATGKVCNSDENCKCECHKKEAPKKAMKCGAGKCG